MAKKPTPSKGRSAPPARKAPSKPKNPASRTVKKKVPVKKAAPAPKKKAPPTLESRLRQMDKDILKLINQRAALTTEQIQSRPNPKKALYDPSNDDRLWQELADGNPGPMTESAVRGVFRQILSAARQKVKTSRVAYLGPPFSFTHIAAIERFGEQADLVPVSTIASVFEEVNRGHADYGLVPIENSTDGRIIDTLDMFRRLPLRICGEVQISVHHNLLARCPRSEITDIYSKPQAISQCRDWLARNMPQAGLHEVTSTSAAAQLAQQARGAAAVASRQAAVQYDLNIIAENIEDSSKNITRFAVIGDDICPVSGEDRTSILLQIPHKPGTLTDALMVFKKNKINLTWIESFPLRGESNGYLFFMDFEGHISDPRIKKALAEVEKMAVTMRVLGAYPRSEPRD
jgi:chorismate mutase/prephenate dehydratase